MKQHMQRNRNLKPASNADCSMNERILLLNRSNSNPTTMGGAHRSIIACAVLLFSFHAAGQVANQLNDLQSSDLQSSNLRSSNLQNNNFQANNLVNSQPADNPSAIQRQNISSRRRLDDIHQAIELIEAEHGAWGSGLSEQLSGLGKAYQLRGEHDQAIEVFARAIHVNRINQGLYDLSQVDIIENMLDSLLVTGNWQEVHERQQYLYWLHRRNYGDSDPRMLPVIDRLGSWYINDYALNPSNRYIGHLVDAYNLFDQATNIIAQEYGNSDLRMIVPLRGLVLSNWYLWTYASQNPASLVSNEYLGGELGTANSFSGNTNRLAPYVRNPDAEGKKVLNRIIDIYAENPNSPPGAEAIAKIELGDWNMLSNRWRSATDLYQEAYLSLSQDEVTKNQLEKIFERPVVLPDLALMESDVEQFSQRGAPSTDQAASSYVLVSFDVNRFGEARNIDILESQPEDNVGIRAQVKRSLGNTRFRPRFVDGEPVSSEGMVHKYLFNEK